MSKQNIFLLIILVFTILVHYLFPSRIVFFTILSLFIVFSLTWDIQGGQMGYNSFGNIVFLIKPSVIVIGKLTK